jgi:hypothetical protein
MDDYFTQTEQRILEELVKRELRHAREQLKEAIDLEAEGLSRLQAANVDELNILYSKVLGIYHE